MHASHCCIRVMTQPLLKQLQYMIKKYRTLCRWLIIEKYWMLGSPLDNTIIVFNAISYCKQQLLRSDRAQFAVWHTRRRLKCPIQYQFFLTNQLLPYIVLILFYVHFANNMHNIASASRHTVPASQMKKQHTNINKLNIPTTSHNGWLRNAHLPWLLPSRLMNDIA